jgi:hypothetical protein
MDTIYIKNTDLQPHAEVNAENLKAAAHAIRRMLTNFTCLCQR